MQGTGVERSGTEFACMWLYQHPRQKTGILIVVEGK
jgi:hypothetical protein